VPLAKWFEVQAAFAVRAASEDDAIAAIADIVRDRSRPAGAVPTVFPVGDFRANPIDGVFPARGRGPKLPPRINPAGVREMITQLESLL
jgi:hypothetical protein